VQKYLTKRGAGGQLASNVIAAMCIRWSRMTIKKSMPALLFAAKHGNFPAAMTKSAKIPAFFGC